MAEIKIGIFGGCRGGNYIDLMMKESRIEVVAVCERMKDRCRRINVPPFFSDFDEFLEYGKSVGMNAVFLSNFFHQHTPYAIKAMENGMDVVSECTAASTLKECVELVECVERTGRKYMLAENYPYMTFNLKMNELVKSGKLGRLMYAEGEYNHTGSNQELRQLTPFDYHWRAWMPRTYYNTHALGPIMYMTDSMPKYVSARAAHSDVLYQIRDWRHNYDGTAFMFCEMDTGLIANVTGCTAMASDYSRYRICGDIASVEAGGNIGPDKVRLYYNNCTKPADMAANETIFTADLSAYGEKGRQAAEAGHNGGDFWVTQGIIDYLADGKEFYFDVYKAVAMSAVAILGWRSCLNHGQNYKIPDFRIKEERDLVRNDDLTPFVNENCEGNTLPCALPWEE